MKKETMIIISSTEIALDTIEMVLKNDYISQTAIPGQFLHISVPSYTLRRPISIADTNKDINTVTIIFKMIGEGTKTLATLQPGMTIDVLGPNGNYFNMDHKNDTTILLIGGGVGIPPLHFLGKSLANKDKSLNIISILGYQTADSVFFEEEFNQFSKTYITTDDGTAGFKGFVTDQISHVGHFDRYYSVGPLPMLQAVTTRLASHKGFISLEERMGCGIGACYACVIKAKDEANYYKICQDGPVFDAKEVRL